jgi:hypothetical protein
MAKKKEIKVDLVYNKDNLKQFNITGNNAFRWAILVLVIVYSLFQIVYLLGKEISLSLIACSFVLIGLAYFYDIFLFNLTYKRTRLNNNDEDLELTLRLTDDKIISQRKGDKKEYGYDYSVVRKLIETKDMMIILLQYKLGFPIMKNNTSSEELEEIKKKILEKNPKVKTRKYHPYKTWILLIFLIINIIFLGLSFIFK